MGKVKWTEKKIEERHRDGYGKGSLSTYKPWVEIFDLNSSGRSRRVWSNKTGRIHHLLSDVEYSVFLAAEWARTVVDIWEQYPLDREVTQTIAHQLGIRHPHYPATQVPTVMTVDFLLTVAGSEGESYLAINAKRDDEAEDENSLAKLEIQRSYFAELETPHHLMYHCQLPTQKIKNISWIRDALLKPGEIEQRPGLYESLKQRMSQELAARHRDESVLAQYCASFDERYGVDPGTGLRVACMLMQERTLCANLDAVDLTSAPLSDFVTAGCTGRLRAVGGSSAV